MSWRKLANRWRGQRLTLPAASTSPAPITGTRQPRPLPLLIIGVAAAVAVWLGAVQGDDRDVAADKAGSRSA